MTLTSSGILQGTPSKQGVYTGKIAVIDSKDRENNTTVTVTVQNPQDVKPDLIGGIIKFFISLVPGGSSTGLCPSTAGQVSCGRCTQGTLTGICISCPSGSSCASDGCGCVDQPTKSQQSSSQSRTGDTPVKMKISTVAKALMGTWKTPSPVTFYEKWKNEIIDSWDQDITWKIVPPNDPTGIFPENVVVINDMRGMYWFGTISGTTLTVSTGGTEYGSPTDMPVGEFTFTSDTITGTWNYDMSGGGASGGHWQYTTTNGFKLIKGDYPFDEKNMPVLVA
jgi:hypothetical protein